MCGCVKCGSKDKLTLHHLDPSKKKFRLAGGTAKSNSTGAVKAEIAKCICLCRICHDLEHNMFR